MWFSLGSPLGPLVPCFRGQEEAGGPLVFPLEWRSDRLPLCCVVGLRHLILTFLHLSPERRQRA